MACNLTAGISKGCRDNAGGIVEVYLANYPTGYTAQEWYTETTGEVTSISGLTGAMYKFEPNKNSSSWVENIQSSVENGTIGYSQELTMVFAKNQASTLNTIKLLGQANMIAIVRNKNEKYFMLGAQDGVELSAGNSASGAALNDLNGWTITLSGMEPYPAYEVSSSIISALLA